MRIKEEFQRTGTFWLPSSPERQVHGTLSVSDGADVKLELTKPIGDNPRVLFGYNPDDV